MKHDEDGFFDRLTSILEKEKQIWWAERTGAAQSTVSNYWLKRKYPKMDKLVKIMELKNISPNWLFYNIGPKYMDYYKKNEIGKRQDYDRRTQYEIMKITDENMRLRDKLDACKAALSENMIFTEVHKSLGGSENSIEKRMLGVFALMRMMVDVVTKMAEKYSKEQVDSKKLEKIFDWVINNKETEMLSTASTLRKLEDVIL
ncbi:MAG: bacteriophage CI repressor [Desulfobacteraceae bacterium]|nr:bacteriophage CI repressor [Desulfobacteraceae bacterium]